MHSPAESPTPDQLPRLYRFVFLWLEPASIAVGALYACFMQSTYLRLTHAASAPPPASLPTSVSIIMAQLANLYLGLAILEASILRTTSELSVWRCTLIGLLIADLGHLLSVRALGSKIYWQYWQWNAIDWGNIPFVYFLALTRICLLLDVGFRRQGLKLKVT
ncbi:hypothetical protein LEMA_P072200.1 [Plenodomus lingam JN3]|uniref:DUF7704 domain-containing protein n=2 Tax=Leptosphaeria maculans TaxID=5022 RepID=E4ZKB7_LEPMJ|nr:hypothetical protein LEMA_P072200.1 [Plenodomus lingam JN3]CBX91712.1 hypothetical protein LEMA_P072200.1 [Plenodomus lingam JN3]